MFSVHQLLTELGAAAAPNERAVRSGRWTDPTTWESGHVPGANAVVAIPRGFDVQIDAVLAPTLKAIVVEGTLSFATTVSTRVVVDTIFVDGGMLQIGAPGAPVNAGCTAVIQFPDTDPAFPLAIDPRAVTRWIVSDGHLLMQGAPKTPRAALGADVVAGALRLPLPHAPTGWTKGDSLLLASTTFSLDFHPAQNEVLPLAALDASGATLTKPTQFAHTRPAIGAPAAASTMAPPMTIYVANLTRNVVIASASTQPHRRGHVMQMTNQVNVGSVLFRDLGRTDKRHPIVDPSLGANGQILPGTNPRARYAFHVHEAGCDGATVQSGPEAMVDDSVVWGSPGWGFVNHSSYVRFTGDVAYDFVGAGFVTEDGDEAGEFIANLAVGGLSTGNTPGDLPGYDPTVPPESLKANREVFANTDRILRGDMGFGGHGFWFQGPDVTVTGNVSAGNKGAGFEFWTNGKLDPATQGYTRFPADRIPANAPYTPRRFPDGSAVINDIPLRAFSDNQAYGNFIGLKVRFSDGFGDVPMDETIPNLTASFSTTGGAVKYVHSQIDRLTVWANQVGVIPSYTRLTFQDVLDVAPIDEIPAAVADPQPPHPATGVWVTGPRELAFTRFSIANYQRGSWWNQGKTSPQVTPVLPSGIATFAVARPFTTSTNP